ncbi:phosphotransferase [Neobacillus drentensis]|uniref:phosphotransferase enzyme family protein n=1 Tax=Neobacillus drentensis TaxID=220684 RepID=UPI001F2DE764|nr:phosphotransferase [Neobacillus drentensis]ULT58393.1 phosphotransferase [Neobacillus drentensis]
MEKSVEVLFTQTILDNFLGCFQLEDKVRKLGDFENYVFEVYQDGKPLVLRITHSSHRKRTEIGAELNWMDFLFKNDVNCPGVIPLPTGDFIQTEKAADGTSFYACLFSKVRGEPVKINSHTFNEELFYAWGREIGKMHRITKQYQPQKGESIRPYWYEEELLRVEDFFSHEPEIIENTQQLIFELRELPQNLDNFGLIHSDIHSGNFFYDGKEVHVFDFDDSSYHWFVSDIAIPLYYSILYGSSNVKEGERRTFSKFFLSHFTRGYEVYHPLPENWKEQLSLFLRLRDITLYSVFHKKISPQDRNDRLNHLLLELRKRIIQKEAIVQNPL